MFPGIEANRKKNSHYLTTVNTLFVKMNILFLSLSSEIYVLFESLWVNFKIFWFIILIYGSKLASYNLLEHLVFIGP